jgi:hypothetical protein
MQKIALMQDIPEEAQTEDDKICIEHLLKALKGGAEAERARGTLLTYIASLTSNRSEGMQFSCFLMLLIHLFFT